MEESFAESRILELTSQVASLEEKNFRLTTALKQAKTQLVSVKEELDQIAAPPTSLALFVRANLKKSTAEIVLNGRHMCLAVSPKIDLATLETGSLVHVDERMIVVSPAGMPREGTAAAVVEIIEPDRVLVDVGGGSEQVFTVAQHLQNDTLRPGDTVIADIRAGFVFERITRSYVEQLLAPELAQVNYSDIGGLSNQLEQIRDALELPFKHPDLYKSYELRMPKGILLYGPPGCGKTLIAKAIATSLAQNDQTKHPYFLSIKGPELLNKYVGETERQIRAIFSRARFLASQDVPVVIFFDEMEALFRTRGSGISSDVETTVVPQLLAEIDGVERLENVIVVGATNREDMIDPAVLRPGRLDIRVRISRPTFTDSREIFAIYLNDAVPVHPTEIKDHGTAARALESMAARVLGRLYATSAESELFLLELVDGSQDKVYIRDLISGAMIAGIVERAKKIAIKNTIVSGETGLKTSYLLAAAEDEIQEMTDLVATVAPREWARVTGRDGASVISMVRIKKLKKKDS